MKYRQKKGSKPIPVLLDQALRKRIDAASRRMGEPKSTVMRIAMRLGLASLEKGLAAEPTSTASVLSVIDQELKGRSDNNQPR